MASRWPTAEPEAFWRAWTRAEVSAKLLDVPILTWLTRWGLQLDDTPRARGIETHLVRIGDLVVCFGRRVPCVH